MLNVTLANNISEAVALASKVNVQIPKKSLEESDKLGDSGGGKILMQAVMRRWLPAGKLR